MAHIFNTEHTNNHIALSSASSRNRSARGKTHQRIAVAHFQDSPPEIPIHLRSVLSAQSDQPRTVRLLCPRKDCRRESHRQMEEIGLRESVLPAMHPDARHELRNELHLSSAQSETGGGQSGGVCTLRMSRMLRLIRAFPGGEQGKKCTKIVCDEFDHVLLMR